MITLMYAVSIVVMTYGALCAVINLFFNPKSSLFNYGIVALIIGICLFEITAMADCASLPYFRRYV